MTTPTNETKPEFIRPGDARRIFGVSRPMVYQWIKAGNIESKVLRQRGKLTGIRLIPYDSIKAYIESQMEDSRPSTQT